MALGSLMNYYDKTVKTPHVRTCSGSSSFISREGQARGALLWEDVQWELPVCSEGRDEAWNDEKGEVENKVQKCSLGPSSS